MNADIIITSVARYNTVSPYRIDPETMPVFILLHKPSAREREEAANYSGNPLYKGKIIPVDITEPNFDRIAQRLNELFPNLSN